MSLFPTGPAVIAGVDAVLRTVTDEALKGLVSPVGVTVGPLDRPINDARLNWFLYSVAPAPALVNMEPPQRDGWTTRRGRPPLALSLHYLLSAEAGELTEDGIEDDVVHAGLSAVMSALHDNGIFGAQTRIATGPDRTVAQVTDALDTMVEPLRLTLETVPIETITALWNTGSHALRLSVGYQVSLVTVPAPVAFTAGPPVRERVIGVVPSVGPVIAAVTPSSASFDDLVALRLRGLADTHTVTLARLPGDPDDPADAVHPSTGPWTLTTTVTADGLAVHLPNGHLVPGRRPLSVTNTVEGLPAGSGQGALTVVPRVVSTAAPLQTGATATLTVRHVTGPGQAFFGALPATYSIATADTVTVTVPALPAGATVPVSLRVGTHTGPPTGLAVAP